MYKVKVYDPAVGCSDAVRMATIECIDQRREWSEYDARTGSSASTWLRG